MPLTTIVALAGLAIFVTGVPVDASGRFAPRVRVDSLSRLFAAFDSTTRGGCVAGVRHGGRVVFRKAYGMASVELGVRNTPATVFGIASLTKQFTALSVALLARQGRLSLDDDIRMYLPELPSYGPPIPLRQLVYHTSGIRDYLSLWSLAGRDIEEGPTESDVLAMLTRQRALNFAPGAQHQYSNSGYFLLSMVVERVTGQSLGDFARKNIFEPLGMTRTFLPSERDQMIRNRAFGYRLNSAGRMTAVNARPSLKGDGGMYSTLDDMLLWAAHLEQSKLDGAWVTLMQEAVTSGRLPNDSAFGYGYGLQLWPHRGARAIAHGGTFGGFRSYMLVLPDQGLSAVVLCNQDEASPFQLSRALVDAFAGAALPPGAAAQAPQAPAGSRANIRASAAELEGYVAEYESDELATTWQISLRGDALYARWGATGAQRLTWRGRDTLTVASATLAFRRQRDAEISGFQISTSRVRGIELTRRNSIIVPRGGPVTLDARLDSAEWAGAAETRMADGSEVLLQHDGRSLSVGIRAAKAGFPSACVMSNDTTRILHASAAVGTATYVRADTIWTLRTPFIWALRDRSYSDSTRRRQDAFVTQHGWTGTTFFMSPTNKEMRIDLRMFDPRDVRFALGYFIANDGPVIAWPQTADDGCVDARVVSGPLPGGVRFDPNRWARLVLVN